MKKKFDIGDFVEVLTPQRVISELIERVKLRRKELKLSQEGLAEKSGVSYASVRRFEATGNISLNSLIKIAIVLKSLEDFNHLFQNQIITNLKDFFN